MEEETEEEEEPREAHWEMMEFGDIPIGLELGCRKTIEPECQPALGEHALLLQRRDLEHRSSD